MFLKFFKNARIYTPVMGSAPLKGAEQGKVLLIEDGAFLVENGRFLAVGSLKEVEGVLGSRTPDLEFDLDGAAVVPGFVDPHTHACFAAKREAEFSMRLAGRPYLDILKAGGGILSSVRSVKNASDNELYNFSSNLLASTMYYGTTTIEIKSGYGLDTQTELRMLRVIDRLARTTPQTVVATFMGAHAIPSEHKEKPEGYVDLLLNEMLPAVQEQGIAQFCDIFCEDGVFSKDQSRRILQKAKELGFSLKIHADEVHDLGGAALAGELKATSAEHLLAASDEGIAAMSQAGVVAVLLPATAYSLRKPFARARTMIEKGVPVALATDLNPGSCFCESMPFVFSLAVMGMGMTPEEALVGTTLNAAWAIGMEYEAGSIEKGKMADFLVLDGETPAVFAYASGARPIRTVWKMGEQVA